MHKVLNRYDHEDRARPKSDFTIKKDSNKKITNPDVVSQTKQSERDGSNINTIVARAKKTGMLGTGLASDRQAQYGDFSNAGDYLQQQNNVIAFKTMFDALDSETRNKFRNQPSLLLEYVNDPKNREEAESLGLLPKPKLERKQEGNEYVSYRNGIETKREPVEKPAEPVTVAPTTPTPPPV